MENKLLRKKSAAKSDELLREAIIWICYMKKVAKISFLDLMALCQAGFNW